MTPRGHAPWQSLPSAEFEGVLHPVFEEDEWKLIAVGGLLGMWVGIFQALFVSARVGRRTRGTASLYTGFIG